MALGVDIGVPMGVTTAPMAAAEEEEEEEMTEVADMGVVEVKGIVTAE